MITPLGSLGWNENTARTGSDVFASMELDVPIACRLKIILLRFITYRARKNSPPRINTMKILFIRLLDFTLCYELVYILQFYWYLQIRYSNSTLFNLTDLFYKFFLMLYPSRHPKSCKVYFMLHLYVK